MSLSDVVVTATRQTASNHALAGSIHVITDQELDMVSSVHPAELLNAVAGVNIHRGSGQEHLTAIRSPVLTGGAGAGSFLYLEDGVPIRAAGFSNINGLFEAMTEISGGVEVVKGPGSVLYGSNAVHGLINTLSRSPRQGWEYTLLGSESGLVSKQASWSSETLRLSGSLVHDDGFRADSGFDQQKLQLRIDERFRAWSVNWVTSFQNLNQETAGFIQGENVYRDDEVRFTNPYPEAFRDGRSFRSYARFERDMPFGARLAITPYARSTELEFLRHFVPGQALEKNGHDSLGVQTTLYGDKDWIVGLDAEYTDGFLYEFQDNPTRFSFTQGLHYDYDVRAVSLAGYGQKEYWLSDKTKLTAGARLEYTDYAYENNANVAVTGRFQRVANRGDNFLSFTPKLSLVQSLSASTNIYARLARGSRAPQTSDLYSLQVNQQPGEIDIETLDSAEVGIKHQGNNWRLELAGFYMEKDNFFFRNADGFNVTDGQTSHVGLEISSQYDVTDWLSVSSDVTWAQHDYQFNDPASGIVTGNRIDTAPETIGHVRATVRPRDDISTQIEWRHVGTYFTNPSNSQAYSGHDVFIWRGEYALSDRLTISSRIDNIFDIKYADRADFAFGNDRYFPGRPRTLFMGLKYATD